MDKCEKNFVGGLGFIILFLILLLPLIATSLVFLGAYAPIIEEDGVSTQYDKFVRTTTTSSLQGALFDGTVARNLSLTTQVFSVIIPILIYTLPCTEYKIFTRSVLLGLLSVIQMPLLIAVTTSIQKIPFCEEKRGGCYDNDPPAKEYLIVAACLTPVGSFAASVMMQVIGAEVKRYLATRAPKQNKSGADATAAQQTPKQNETWEAARKKAKQEVLDAAARAVESGDAHFLSLANLTSATFQSTDSRSFVLGMETRTVSEGAMTFHKGLEADCLRANVPSITGYGNNRDGSFMIVEGQLSVWSGKAYWVTLATSSKIQTLIAGTFARSLPNADTAGGISFVGSLMCDNCATGELKTFTLHPKNVEETQGEPDIELGVEPLAGVVASNGDSGPTLAPQLAQDDTVCSVHPVDSDDLPTGVSLPIAQAEILPEKTASTT